MKGVTNTIVSIALIGGALGTMLYATKSSTNYKAQRERMAQSQYQKEIDIIKQNYEEKITKLEKRIEELTNPFAELYEVGADLKGEELQYAKLSLYFEGIPKGANVVGIIDFTNVENLNPKKKKIETDYVFGDLGKEKRKYVTQPLFQYLAAEGLAPITVFLTEDTNKLTKENAGWRALVRRKFSPNLETIVAKKDSILEKAIRENNTTVLLNYKRLNSWLKNSYNDIKKGDFYSFFKRFSEKEKYEITFPEIKKAK